MNTANKLTLSRVVMIPLFLVVLYLGFPFSQYVALAIFILASITDFVDGYIARHCNQVTDFGKFMDPLADKLLVMASSASSVGMGSFSLSRGWAVSLSTSSFRDMGRPARRLRARSSTSPRRTASSSCSRSSSVSSMPEYSPKQATSFPVTRRMVPSSRWHSHRP